MVNEGTDLFPDKSIWNCGLGLRNDIAGFEVSGGPRRHLTVLICLDDRSDILMLPCIEIVERAFRVEAVFEILKTLRGIKDTRNRSYR